ncbi:MAG: metal-sensing transcriptional repressor [Acetatifactor sp.]|nr:metal-sensing transcriptional repressor [Acetatifactor sp.]
MGKNNGGNKGDINNVESAAKEQLLIGVNEGENCRGCHQKSTPRRPEDLKALKNRLSRMQGQLTGIGRMLDENRYCGDILIQIGAVESALQAFGNLILKEHMETCVLEKIRQGDTNVMAETMELIERLR